RHACGQQRAETPDPLRRVPAPRLHALSAIPPRITAGEPPSPRPSTADTSSVRARRPIRIPEEFVRARTRQSVKGADVSRASVLREQIDSLVREYHHEQFSNRPFNPEADLVHYAGRVFDAEELCNLVDASLDFFLTANRYAEKFEADFADYLGVSNALLVNSGSSANLVALTALTSPKLGDRRLKPGDEVVTVAAAFPTTLAPILQNNLVPVFVDVNL